MLEVRRFARTQEDPMTDDRLPLPALLAKAGDGDFLRRVAEDVVQLLMETDMEGLIGAGRHECSGERTTYRNGYRDRSLDTRLGSLQLVDPLCGSTPKRRQGSYFPPLLNQLFHQFVDDPILRFRHREGSFLVVGTPTPLGPCCPTR